MKYGLSFPNGGTCGDARTLAEFAHLAEESGWDGACLYKMSNDDFAPAEVRDMKAFIEQHRQTKTALYDIALGGRHRGDDWERERALINSLAEAGMTWWAEYLAPQTGGLNEMRVCISRGPLRID